MSVLVEFDVTVDVVMGFEAVDVLDTDDDIGGKDDAEIGTVGGGGAG